MSLSFCKLQPSCLDCLSQVPRTHATSAAALLLHERSYTGQYWNRTMTVMVLHILVPVASSLFLLIVLWKLLAIELWLSSLAGSCMCGNAFEYVCACVYGITACKIPQILGVSFHALDLLTRSVTVSWCLPFPLCFKAVLIWFEQAGPSDQNLHSAASVPAYAGSLWTSVLAHES